MRKVFQQKVWALIKEVPKGKVTTYKAIAEKLGTKAYRAVGQACNKNPYWPQVPCHRVVCADGSVGGFARGVREKIALLHKEGIIIKGNHIQKFRKKVLV